MASTTPPPTAAAFAQSTRIMVGSLIGALFFIALSLYYVLGSQEDGMTAPALIVLLALVVAGGAVHLVVEAVGYRTPALETSLSEEDAAAKARVQWQSGMVLRFALCEFIAIASIAAAFVLTEGGFVTYLVGMLVSVVLMALHVWPGERAVGKVADSLERDGQPSYLRETFGA